MGGKGDQTQSPGGDGDPPQSPGGQNSGGSGQGQQRPPSPSGNGQNSGGGGQNSGGGQPPPNPPPFDNLCETVQMIVINNGNFDQMEFMAKYQHAYNTVDRLISLLDKVDSSDNPRPLVQMILSDVDDLQKRIAELQWSVYRYFSATTVQSGLKLTESDQEIAVELVKELVGSFDDVRERAFQKKEYYGTEAAGSPGLKPPKQSVPRYGGNHAEWAAFKANFLNLVRPLPDLDKLRLLLEAVDKSDAKDTIKDLALTTENWPIAWKRMCTRYDSPREAVHAALRPFIEFPKIKGQQTESLLHKLISAVRTTQAQLAQINLGAISEAEVLYEHILMSKLDTNTFNKFNESQKTNAVPTLNACIEFLEKRAKDVALTREIMQQPPPATNNQGQQPNKDHKERAKDKGVFLPLQPKAHPTGNRAGNSGYKPKPASQQQSPQGGQRNQGGPPNSNKNKGPFTPPNCALCHQAGHRTQACPKYLAMNQPQRKQAVQKARLCFSCLSPNHATRACTSKFRCLVCNGTHHTSLHVHTSDLMPSQPVTVLSPVAVCTKTTGLVPTAKILLSANGNTQQVRSLLDTGAAGCFISATSAAALNLQPSSQGQTFSMANGQKVASKGMVRVQVSALPPHQFSTYVMAHVMPILLNSNVPTEAFNVGTWKHLSQCNLADQEFNKPAPVDFIIGLPVLDEILMDGRIIGDAGQATAHNTKLGYVVMGPRPTTNVIATVKEEQVPAIEDVNFDLQRFWTVDTLQVSSKPVLTPEEQFCEDHFIANTTRLESGRYQIKWPFLKSPETLGFSYNLAVKRWLSVERKLLQTPDRHHDYIQQLQEYLDLNQMEKVPINEVNKSPNYYIPHHAVIKLSSTTTKLRIVFDASAKTTTGLSLNSLLPPGPTTQPDLFRQLLHFRENPLALKADVTKMYRQIYVHPEEQDLIRIIWRSSPSHPIEHYRLKVVPFGVTTAPFMACRILQQLADDEEVNYPEAAAVLRKRFYVDDLGTSVLNIDTAKKLYDDLSALLTSGGFQLRKWATNSSELLAVIPEANRETASDVDMDDTSAIKTLGIKWTPRSDAFTFTCNPDMQRTHTKRNILSETSKVFDPLGLISPVTIKSKILMQKIWKCAVGWDDPLPPEISEEWTLLSNALTSLDLLPIPRALRNTDEGIWELHGYADASQDAYAAVVYIRQIHNGNITTNLIASKTRVAPLKPLLTIPRLELQAAVLLVDIVAVIQETITIPIQRVFYWTDSAIALHWIKSLPQRWKLFIRNRVSAIQEKSNPDDWAHVVSADNPADCASRGLFPSELKDFSLWWKGPTWLQEQNVPIPALPGMPPEIDTEASSTAALAPVQTEVSFLSSLTRLGSWSKIIRVLTRLITIFRMKTFRGAPPTPQDSNKAETALVRLIQFDTFPEIMEDPSLISGKTLYKRLRALRPFLAADGTLRVGGRLHLSDAPYNLRHPQIIPGNHEIIR